MRIIPSFVFSCGVIFWFYPAQAQPDSVISRFLTKVTENSADYAVSQLEEKSEALNFQLNLAQFDTSGFLGASFADSDDPQTSPFSPTSTKRQQYTTGVSKFWDTGFTTELNYSVTDNVTTFPARPSADFVLPDVSLTFKTSLLRDLIGGRKRQIEPQIESEIKTLSLNAKIQRKQILVQALLELSEILEIGDELELQKNLCARIAEQAGKLKTKFDRRSISRREFLLSQKDLNICKANLNSLEKALEERKINLKVEYSVNEEFYKSLKVETFFSEVSKLFNAPEYSPQNADIKNRNELLSLKQNLETLKLRSKELEAEKYPELSLEFSAGYKGIDNAFSTAQQDIYNSTFPYIIGSIRIEFPFSNRVTDVNHQVNIYQLEILKKQIAQQEAEALSRFKILQNGLSKDLSIYKSYKTNVELSQQVLQEGRRDFANGRIDFYNLSEFQKALIQSRQQLANLRTQIVIQTVEYLDYFHFFDRYY